MTLHIWIGRLHIWIDHRFALLLTLVGVGLWWWL